MPARAIDLDLRRQWEADSEAGRAELADLLLGAGLLGAELVAGKTDHRKALAGELPLQLLETRILRRVPAPACHVDRKHDLTTQRVQKIGRAVDPGHAVVEESRHEAPPV